VPDDIGKEAAWHYDERGVGALVLPVAAVNVWNRLRVATRQVAASGRIGGGPILAAAELPANTTNCELAESGTV
jgi:hypothetical protein